MIFLYSVVLVFWNLIYKKFLYIKDIKSLSYVANILGLLFAFNLFQ